MAISPEHHVLLAMRIHLMEPAYKAPSRYRLEGAPLYGTSVSNGEDSGIWA